MFQNCHSTSSGGTAKSGRRTPLSARPSASCAMPSALRFFESLTPLTSSPKKPCLKALACRSYWWNLYTRPVSKPKLSLRHRLQNHSPAGTLLSGGSRQRMWKPQLQRSHNSIESLSSPSPQTSHSSSPGLGGS